MTPLWNMHDRCAQTSRHVLLRNYDVRESKGKHQGGYYASVWRSWPNVAMVLARHYAGVVSSQMLT